MLIRTMKIVLLIAVTCAASLAAAAQTKPEDKESKYVETKGFQGKVFEIKHREPFALMQLLAPLGSGFKGATISYSNEYRSLSVRDFPENIAAIEEAIKRLDVPGDRSKDPDIEIELHILMATNAEGVSSQSPASLKDVIKQLQGTLNYKSYHLLTSVVQRAKVRGQLQGSGVVEIPQPIATDGRAYTDSYSFRVNRFSLSTEQSGVVAIQMDNFAFTLREPAWNAEIATSLGVREGEKVVVGTTSLRDKAMILVLSAKMVK